MVNETLTTVTPMSIVSIDVRQAKLADAGGVAEVHSASWLHAYTGVIPHQSLSAMVRRRDDKWWARAIRHSTRILVLEDKGEIVGYATLGANRVGALPQEGEIYEIYLLPEYQGVGLGKKLFLSARKELHKLGLKGCVTWVLEDNDPAMQFYANAGGQDVAEGTETFNGKTLNKIAFSWD